MTFTWTGRELTVNIGVEVTGGVTLSLSPETQTVLQGMSDGIASLQTRLARVETKIDTVQQQEQKMADTLDNVVADLDDLTTVEEGGIRLLDTISAQLAAAGTDPAKLAALRKTIAANKQAWIDAVVRNTPAATA